MFIGFAEREQSSEGTEHYFLRVEGDFQGKEATVWASAQQEEGELTERERKTLKLELAQTDDKLDLFHSSAVGGLLETQSHQISYCWKYLWKIVVCLNFSSI